MNSIKLLKTYFIDFQIYVALMGTIFAVFFMEEQNAFRFPCVILIFVTYLGGYLYTKYQGHRKYFKKILIFNAFLGIISMSLIIYNHNEIRIVKWLVIVVLGLLYNSKFLSSFIRKIPLVKIFYVALVWALVNSWLFLPTINWGIFFISWLFISAMILPFDIRDIHEKEIVTFPRLIGVQNTKYLAYLMLSASALIAIETLQPVYALAYFLTMVIAFVMVYFSEPKRNELYFSFWVDLIPFFPLFFLVLLKYF